MKPAIICDLDGTLASNDWRSHWVEKGRHARQFHTTTPRYPEAFPVLDVKCTMCGSQCPWLASKNPDKHQEWDRFYDDLNGDPIVPGVAALISLANEAGHAILLVSGRDAAWKYPTEIWLADHDVEYAALYMRPTKDHRPDYTIKQEIYETHIKPHYDVRFVIDDRPSVIKTWKNLGLPVIQVIDPCLPPNNRDSKTS